MADVFTELAVKLRGPNPGTEEAQVTSTAGGALQVEEVGTSYAEDSVHTSTDSGTFVLGVRNDTLAALVDTDGDYAPFQVDASGALYVNVSNTVTISDGGGSITVDGTVSIISDYEYAEDSVHTTADVGAFVLAVRNDAGTPLAGDGDYIPFTTDSSGALRVTGGGGGNAEYAEDSVHTSGDIGNYVLTVREDTLSASTTATGDYQSFKTDGLGRLWINQRGAFAEDSVHTSGDDGQFVLAVRNDTLAPLAGTDGDYAPFQVDALGALYVNVANTTDIAVVTNYEYAEDSVHTSADVGAFVLAVRNDTLASLVDTDGDYAPLQVDADGALYVTGSFTINSEYAEDTVHTSGDTGSYVLSVREDTLASSTTATGDYQSFKTDSLGRLWINQRGAFAEDSVHTSADDGQFILAVRNDTLATLVDTDGDYAPFQVDASGALYVTVDSVNLSSEYAEDSVHTSGDIGQFVLAVRNDAETSLAADGDYTPLQTDATGRLKVDAEFTSAFDYPEDSVHTDGDQGAYVLSVREDTLAASTTTSGDYQSFKTDSLGRLWINQRGAFAEDSVHTSGDDGQFVLAVRNDVLAPLAGTDGDYAPFQMDADGALYVNVSGRISLDSEYAEDSVHTSADIGQFVLAVRNDTLAALADTDGDYAPLQVDADGALYVTGSFGINSEYAEDTVHTSGDTGSYVLSVREDTLATSTTATGDYQSFKTDSLGRLWINQRGAFAEDSVHTSADDGQFVLAVRNDTLATLVDTDGDYAPFQVDASGALYVAVDSINLSSEYAEDTVHTDGDIGSYVLSVREDTLAASTTATGDYQSFKTDGLGRLWINQRGAFAEDSVHTSGDDGQFVLAVRNDTLAPLAGTDGDYAPFQVDALGALYVNVANTTDIAVVTNYEYAEDSVHTTADVGAFVLAVRNDTLATLVDADGDYAPLQVNADGALYVSGSFAINSEYAEDSVHTSGDTGSYVLSVREDTLASSTTATGDYQSFKTDSLGRLWINQRGAFPEDSVHTSGDDGQFVLAVRNDTLAPLAGTDGDYAPLQVDALGALYTDVASISIGHVDDSAFAVGTDEVIGSGFLYDDTGTDSVDEGDIGIGRMTADRRQLMRIGGNTDANRVNVDDGDMMLVDRIQDTNVEHTVGTVTAVANNADGTITHTVADGDVFYLKQITAASSGAPMKVVVQYDDGAVTTLGTFFYSDAVPYVDVTFDQPIPITGVLGGTDVEVVITNRAGPAQDVYGSISGRVADLT